MRATPTLRVGSDSGSHEAVSDAQGRFRLDSLAPGPYAVTARRIGYRVAELRELQLLAGQTASIRVTLSGAGQTLSAIVVVASPLTVDATTPEAPVRIESRDIPLLPTGRTASSLVTLVPGARPDQLWGGGGPAANTYLLDGVPMNNPGAGGDFLQIPIDWIDALEVRGLGAGAAYGNFQGGAVNAVTKTGSNVAHTSLRTNFESPRFTGSNLNLGEVGSEPAGRTEVSGEIVGPIRRDRLFYFFGGQYVQRDVRALDLAAPALGFQPVQEGHGETRAMSKLTWLPGDNHRVDVSLGEMTTNVANAGLNGVDDVSALRDERTSTTFYTASWTGFQMSQNSLEAKIGGFNGRDASVGQRSDAIPGVQVLQLGLQPAFQNAPFSERTQSRSLSGDLAWHSGGTLLSLPQRFSLGATVEREAWGDDRTRDGGLTWRPYTAGNSRFDPTLPSTWGTIGSDWGGETRLHTDAENDALFAEDAVSWRDRLTVTLGARLGGWTAWASPPCDSACHPRFKVLSTSGLDPRTGVVWKATEDGTLAVKASVGRYHQGMFPLFVDRAAGVDAYANQRFYYTAPKIPTGYVTYTPAQRDSLLGPGGFSPFFNELILNESGPVKDYRQPYVDQWVLGVEKAIAARWRVDALYVHRRNGDIVGLVDRNLATNYSPLYNVQVSSALGFGQILDANLKPLVLPVVYVANTDLLGALQAAARGQPHFGPYTAADIPRLTWNPDVVLTSVPAAQREYQQYTLTLRTSQADWRAEGSVSAVQLRGNVAGVTGYGAAGTSFSAGPFVRPNEAINDDGLLPNASQFEGKLWLTTRLPHRMQAGAIVTHVLGEHFTPTFQLGSQYRYSFADTLLPDTLFAHVLGQTIFVEPRGSRQYASRSILDLHWDWRAYPEYGVIITADLFNATANQAITEVKTAIDDQAIADPASYLGAPRLRVSPRTLRLGVRIE